MTLNGSQCIGKNIDESDSNSMRMQFVFSTNVLRSLQIQYEPSIEAIPTVRMQYNRSTNPVRTNFELLSYRYVFDRLQYEFPFVTNAVRNYYESIMNTVR